VPVRSVTPSLLRWHEPEQILNQGRHWAALAAAEHPGLERVGLFGSYGRGEAGVGSDLDCC
jgi:predicted nucleotidyltransferase